MTPLAWMLLLFYLLILLVLAWPVGRLLTALVEGSVPAPLRRVESLLLGRCGRQLGNVGTQSAGGRRRVRL